jgi:iron complex transport system substrate-binding protein
MFSHRMLHRLTGMRDPRQEQQHTDRTQIQRCPPPPCGHASVRCGGPRKIVAPAIRPSTPIRPADIEASVAARAKSARQPRSMAATLGGPRFLSVEDGGVRLVSLLPSATEIAYALGLGDDLIGVTFECDEPPSARVDKTVVVGGRDTHGMSPSEIDDYVKAQLSAGADLYTLHADALAALDPELILTQDLCRVCALPSTHVEEALDYLGCRADVLTLDPYSLDDVLDTIVAVGDRTGVPDRAQALVADLRSRLGRVAAAVNGRARPRVAVVEWIDPPFTAGHWVPDLVHTAGGEPVAGRAGARSVQTTWEELTAATPDIVLVAPCGFHLDGATQQARTIAPRFPDAAVWAIDADGIVVRPGPRLVDGVEAIAAILHPGAVADAPATAIARVP